MIRDIVHILTVSLLLLITGDLCAQEVQEIIPDTIEVEEAYADTIAIDSVMLAQADSLYAATADSLSKPRVSRYLNWQPDPIRAMWLSMVLPGAGQVYNRKYWKLPLLYGGFLGCMYALNWNNQMLRDYSQAYLDIMDDDPMTCSYEKMLPIGYDVKGHEESLKNIFKHKKDYFRRFRDLSVFAFVGVYILGVIDAYVDAELSTFDISKDLTFHWQAGFIQTPMTGRFGTPAISCQLNY